MIKTSSIFFILMFSFLVLAGCGEEAPGGSTGTNTPISTGDSNSSNWGTMQWGSSTWQAQ